MPLASITYLSVNSQKIEGIIPAKGLGVAGFFFQLGKTAKILCNVNQSKRIQ
jgi:hypothetical protein